MEKRRNQRINRSDIEERNILLLLYGMMRFVGLYRLNFVSINYYIIVINFVSDYCYYYCYFLSKYINISIKQLG